MPKALKLVTEGVDIQAQAGWLQRLCCGLPQCLSSYPNQLKFSFFIYTIELIGTLLTLQDCNEDQKVTWVTTDCKQVRWQKHKKVNYIERASHL